MTQDVIMISTLVLLLATWVGFPFFCRYLQKKVLDSVECDLVITFTDLRHKLLRYLQGHKEQTHGYLVVKQWYDNLHITAELYDAESAYDAYMQSMEDGINKTYSIINVVEL